MLLLFVLDNLRRFFNEEKPQSTKSFFSDPRPPKRNLTTPARLYFLFKDLIKLFKPLLN